MSKTCTVGHVEIATDDPNLIHYAPEMLQVLYATAKMLYADGPLYVTKLTEAGPWTPEEKSSYLRLMEQTMNLLIAASSGRLLEPPEAS